MFAVLAAISFLLALFHWNPPVNLVTLGLLLFACHFIWDGPYITRWRTNRRA